MNNSAHHGRRESAAGHGFVCLLAVVSVAIAVSLGGCTTSRAVLAWEAGWKAEAQGKYKVAAKRYAEAYSRNEHLVGAELNRIRLLARAPDKRLAAGKALDALLKKKGEVPQAAIFGATWALQTGEHKQAAARLAPVRPKIVAMKGCAPLRRDFHRADLQVQVSRQRWQPAAKIITALNKRCGTGAVPPATGALVAWNTGDPKGASAWLGRMPADAPGSHLLRALLALHGGYHKRATTLLAAVDRPDLNDLILLLQAHAALAGGDAAGAERLARRALDARPTSTAPQQLLGVALLRRGDVARARDLLAGAAARYKGTPPWSLSFDLALAELRLGRLRPARAGFEAAARACTKGECEVAKRNVAAMVKLGL